MAKEIKAKVRLHIPGGEAKPGPPVGSVLGQHGLAPMDFCKQFNAKTADKRGQTCPTVVIIYKDRTFDFVIKTPPASELIRKKANIQKGATTPFPKGSHLQKGAPGPSAEAVGSITAQDVEEIAKLKMVDLNAHTIDQAIKIIAGSARSMGVKITE